MQKVGKLSEKDNCCQTLHNSAVEDWILNPIAWVRILVERPKNKPNNVWLIFLSAVFMISFSFP